MYKPAVQQIALLPHNVFREPLLWCERRGTYRRPHQTSCHETSPRCAVDIPAHLESCRVKEQRILLWKEGLWMEEVETCFDKSWDYALTSLGIISWNPMFCYSVKRFLPIVYKYLDWQLSHIGQTICNWRVSAIFPRVTIWKTEPQMGIWKGEKQTVSFGKKAELQ